MAQAAFRVVVKCSNEDPHWNSITGLLSEIRNKTAELSKSLDATEQVSVNIIKKQIDPYIKQNNKSQSKLLSIQYIVNTRSTIDANNNHFGYYLYF